MMHVLKLLDIIMHGDADIIILLHDRFQRHERVCFAIGYHTIEIKEESLLSCDNAAEPHAIIMAWMPIREKPCRQLSRKRFQTLRKTASEPHMSRTERNSCRSSGPWSPRGRRQPSADPRRFSKQVFWIS